MKSQDASAPRPVKLRSGLVPFALDDDMIVFSETDQRLISLNAAAASVFLDLQRGAPVSKLSDLLVSKGLAQPENGQEWVTLALDALGSQGLLEEEGPAQALPATQPEENRLLALRVSKMPPYRAGTDMIEKRYRLLQTRALIRFEHPAQVRLVDAVIGHLACEDTSAPTVVLEIQALSSAEGRHLRSRIYRDGQAINSVPKLSELAPFVKSALWQTAVNTYDFRFYIHAGVVGIGETCILLPAAAGSGKSSLTTALTHGGYRYYSDEVALIERASFKVPPMPLAICTKSTGWDVMRRYYPDLLTLPTHRRDDGKEVRYIPPPPHVDKQSPVSVSHIIFPRYEPGASTELRPVARSQALRRLMDECLAARERLDRANVGDLIQWIAGIDCYALVFSSLDEAVALVKKTAPPTDASKHFMVDAGA